MTGQLELSTSPPAYCWICQTCRPVDLSGCGPECIEEEQ